MDQLGRLEYEILNDLRVGKAKLIGANVGHDAYAVFSKETDNLSQYVTRLSYKPYYYQRWDAYVWEKDEVEIAYFPLSTDGNDARFIIWLKHLNSNFLHRIIHQFDRSYWGVFDND